MTDPSKHKLSVSRRSYPDDDDFRLEIRMWLDHMAKTYMAPLLAQRLSAQQYRQPILEHGFTDPARYIEAIAGEAYYRTTVPDELLNPLSKNPNARNKEVSLTLSAMSVEPDPEWELLGITPSAASLPVAGQTVYEVEIPVWFGTNPALTGRLFVWHIPGFIRRTNPKNQTHNARIFTPVQLIWSEGALLQLEMETKKQAIAPIIARRIEAYNLAHPFAGGLPGTK